MEKDFITLLDEAEKTPGHEIVERHFIAQEKNVRAEESNTMERKLILAQVGKARNIFSWLHVDGQPP